MIFNKASESIKVDSKIIVFLIETGMKYKFLENYSHDLLVSNEETAVCLEELNRENKKGTKFKNGRKKVKDYEEEGLEYPDEFNEEDDSNKNENEQSKTHF